MRTGSPSFHPLRRGGWGVEKSALHKLRFPADIVASFSLRCEGFVASFSLRCGGCPPFFPPCEGRPPFSRPCEGCPPFFPPLRRLPTIFPALAKAAHHFSRPCEGGVRGGGPRTTSHRRFPRSVFQSIRNTVARREEAGSTSEAHASPPPPPLRKGGKGIACAFLCCAICISPRRGIDIPAQGIALGTGLNDEKTTP